MALASGHWLERETRGEAPGPRYGHAVSVAGSVAFLFGGASDLNHEENEPVYFNDFYMLTVSLTWDRLATGGVAPRTLGHSSVAVGDNIYVYGGNLGGSPTDDLLAFMFGGQGADGHFCKDLHVLNTGNLLWQKWEVKGESPAACSGQTLSAHHDKDVYLFGGRGRDEDGTETSSNEIHKLSIAKMKWKVPLYVGLPPARRHGHTAFILHSHLYVFGGKNEEQEFNDLKVMKLINPSERQPVMKEILSEFGLQGVSHRDFGAVRDEAMKRIQAAFALLDQEFHKLDREKSELSKAAAALLREKEAHEVHRQQQQQVHHCLNLI
ncbi:putative rab9 effector protein with kelch motifs-like [Scophthalmus maximus]|uniref:Putative rab9 effector protein with kelch motifs-like n=1 Tax=Scophthalmus maximus TaxID=52904 RepID=A0A2U9CF84_SCOMX|nr:putative rab9 effector protein with kelch motifs-like [Scophthalmus maximus]